MTIINNCPYCQGELSPPTRKKSCPHCNKIIFARTRPNKPRGWVRQEDLLAISKEWADQSLNRCAQWVAQLKYDGFTDNDFTHAKNILQKRFKGKEPNIRDVVWYLFNQLAIKQAMTGNAPAYYMMALFVDEEGKNPFLLLKTNCEIDLQMWKRSSHVKTVKICTGGDQACENCRELEGAIFGIDDAIKQNILPCKECIHKTTSASKFNFCRCMWRPEKISMD